MGIESQQIFHLKKKGGLKMHSISWPNLQGLKLHQVQRQKRKLTFNEKRWLIFYKNQVRVPLFIEFIRLKHAWLKFLQSIHDEWVNTKSNYRDAIIGEA
jgi:hypothetical protein